MVSFIARGIKKAFDNSPEEGMELYRKYFINTKLYAGYKAGVDEILEADGYAEAIVAE
jgi:hypothetical protein